MSLLENLPDSIKEDPIDIGLHILGLRRIGNIQPTKLQEPLQDPLQDPLQNPLQDPLKDPLKDPLQSEETIATPNVFETVYLKDNNFKQNEFIFKKPKRVVRRRKAISSRKTSTELLQSGTTDSKPTENIQQVLPEELKFQHSIVLSLRNMLKLAKARKWVMFEWFYADIDRDIYNAKEFETCINQTFPNLRTRQLTRIEWGEVRSALGTPRRCSPSFFMMERFCLESRRQRLRYLQTHKFDAINDITTFLFGLPNKIPFSLPLRSKILAWLHWPYIGIHPGTVMNFDPKTSIYRVSMDDPSIGNHSVPDFRILPKNSCTSSFSILPRGSAIPFFELMLWYDNIHGYPPEIPDALVRLKSVMLYKWLKLERLRQMNNIAELIRMQSQEDPKDPKDKSKCDLKVMPEPLPELNEEFQRSYASILLSMEKMNREMLENMAVLSSLGINLAINQEAVERMAPNDLNEMCRLSAKYQIDGRNKGEVFNQGSRALIVKLGAVLGVVSYLGKAISTSQVASLIANCVMDIHSSLEESLGRTFLNCVQGELYKVIQIFRESGRRRGS